MKGIKTMSANVYVEDVYFSWIRACEQRVTKKTLAFYKGNFENHIMPYLKGNPIGEVKEKEFENVFNNLDPKHPRLPTLTRGVLMNFLNYSYKNGFIEKKPKIDGSYNLVKRVEKNQSFQDYLSPLNNNDIVNALPLIKKSKYRDFILFVLYSGLRKNECLALKWKNVSDDLKSVSITHKADADDERLWNLKIVSVSVKRNRTIFLTRRAKEILASMRNECCLEDEYIFKDNGQPLYKNQYQLNNEMKRIQRKLKNNYLTIGNIENYFSAYYLYVFMNDYEVGYFEGNYMRELIGKMEMNYIDIEGKIRLIDQKLDNVLKE